MDGETTNTKQQQIRNQVIQEMETFLKGPDARIMFMEGRSLGVEDAALLAERMGRKDIAQAICDLVPPHERQFIPRSREIDRRVELAGGKPE